MKIRRWLLTAGFLILPCATIAWAQDQPSPNLAGAPPKMLVLVYQQFFSGKAAERHGLEVAISRASNQLDVPNSWIDLDSISGPPEALFFDPFDSFEQVDTAFAEWARIFATHPELARMQDELKALVSEERTLIAVRRDDLGFRHMSIDFSKARFLRVLEVRLHPGHESEFVEAFRNLGRAYESIKADTPWVVYQVNVGLPSPTFLVFLPMRTLKKNDDLLDWRRSIRDAEGQQASDRAEQIARDGYVKTESNLFAIRPEASRVSSDFAAGDPEFWLAKPPAAKPRKDTDAKPKP
jgi:hypothetical protein